MRVGALASGQGGTSWQGQTYYPVEAKWPVGASLTGGVIGTTEASIDFDGSKQSFMEFVPPYPTTNLFFNSATEGAKSVARAVAASAGVAGTGDWIMIARLESAQPLDPDTCNLAIDGVSYSEASMPGFIA